MGENIYLFCDVGGNKVTILWREMLDIGDKVAFSITKFRRFKDGVLISLENGKDSE